MESVEHLSLLLANLLLLPGRYCATQVHVEYVVHHAHRRVLRLASWCEFGPEVKPGYIEVGNQILANQIEVFELYFLVTDTRSEEGILAVGFGPRMDVVVGDKHAPITDEYGRLDALVHGGVAIVRSNPGQLNIACYLLLEVKEAVPKANRRLTVDTHETEPTNSNDSFVHSLLSEEAAVGLLVNECVAGGIFEKSAGKTV